MSGLVKIAIFVNVVLSPMRRLFVILVMLASVSCGSADNDYVRVPLDSGWSFRRAGTDEWYPAFVPGVVHTDLLRNGLIDDPYRSTNESRLQWIENEEWEYRTVFVPTAEQLSAGALVLDFKGLDTYAEVRLNDSLVLEADNMFVEWRVPVKGIVREGDNTLCVKFLSAYKEGCRIAEKYPKLPADNDKGPEYKTSVFTRKAQYHYGWDWGPRFVTAGIWKPVYLESYDYAALDNIRYAELSQSPKRADFVATVTINSLGRCDGVLTLTDESGDEYARRSVSLTEGKNIVELPFSIDNPEYWWPCGIGKGLPRLYPVEATLVTDGSKAWSDRRKIGVRTVELVRERDTVGESFFFRVNGEPIFMKGANVIPQDMFLPEVTVDRYRRMAQIARDADMNMLRVWGGGIYESDAFYDACDSLGVLVWQDFPFACAFYPWDEEFYGSVRLEAVQNVRRLRNHPSLAVWCGNNEVDEAWHRWGYKEDTVRWPWTPAEREAIRKGIDDLFFTTVLPGVVAEEDPSRPYHPSSPLYGWGDSRSRTSGDLHYWGVFHGGEPFSAYKERPGRFSNEYGHQSLANYDTWRRWLSDDDMEYCYTALGVEPPYSAERRRPEDDPFYVHQKNARGYGIIRDYMQREVPVPDSLREYIYMSQLVQADGIRTAMEAHRRNRPFTMGSIYWQMNDCWPVTSWSGMDYPFGYKALHYFARRSFAPVLLSLDMDGKSGTVELWGVNDELEERKGGYTLTLMTFGGDTLSSRNGRLALPKGSSAMLFSCSAEELLKGADPRKVVLVCDGEIDGRRVRTSLLFRPYKELELPEADIRIVSVEKCADCQRVTLEAGNFVKAVVLEPSVRQADNSSDAYFDMLPGERKTVTVCLEDNRADADYRIVNLNDMI